MTEHPGPPGEEPEKLAAIVGAVEMYLAQEHRAASGTRRRTGRSAWQTAVWELSRGGGAKRSWRGFG